MIETKIFCDVCGKECQPQEGKGTFGGVITRMNVNLERQPYQFMQDYCSSCAELVLSFINDLREDIKKKADKKIK